MPEKKLYEDVLLHEYERMCEEIRTVESNNEKVIAFGLSIITAAFTIGVAQHVVQIFLIIPLALVGVFLYATLLYTYVFSMGGYKAYLEDRLNERLGERVLLWERLVQIRQAKNPIRPALVAIYLLIGIILGAVSEAFVEVHYGLYAMLAVALVTLALLYVLLVSIARMWRIYKIVYDAATADFKASNQTAATNL